MVIFILNKDADVNHPHRLVLPTSAADFISISVSKSDAQQILMKCYLATSYIHICSSSYINIYYCIFELSTAYKPTTILPNTDYYILFELCGYLLYAAFELACLSPHYCFDGDICTTSQAPLAAEGNQAVSSNLPINRYSHRSAYIAADRRQLNSIQLGKQWCLVIKPNMAA